MRKSAFLSLALLSILFVAVSAQAETENTRTFEVNWNTADNNDADVQMCDDNYYTKAEILIPARPALNKQELKTYIEEQCEGIEVTVDSVSNGGKSFHRYTLDGQWGCSLEFNKPLTAGDKRPARYTIDLGDAS